MPKVTIYILNFNYGRYISQAIKSVLSQTYDNLEILIIDDGSTDNSIEVINKFADKVKIIKQENIGLVKSIIKAFSIAKGEYVMRLDADDWLDPSCIDKLVKKIEQYKDVALVFPDYFEVDEFGQIIRRIKRHDFSENVSMYDQPAHGACTLTRKEHYFSVGGHDESFQCQDGVDIWLSLTEKYNVINVKEPLFYYRKHNQSLSDNEEKILSTRSSIYKSHAKKRGYIKENTYAFIPIRTQKLDGKEYALSELGGKTIIEWVLEKTKISELIDKTVILVDTNEMKSELKKLINCDNIIISKRDKKYSAQGISATKSIKEYLSKNNKICPDNIVTLTTDYPFSRYNYVDTAIFSMFLFGSNSIDSVVMDNSIFYYHDGTGLKQWVDSKIRQEREDIYLRRGGISVFKNELLNIKNDEVSEKKGHVIVDKISSFEIRSSEDIIIGDLIAKKLI